MNGKKVVSVFLIIIGIVVAVPFNYIYDMEAFEVDLVWVTVGIAMIGFGVYSLKKRKK
jgi:Flp pilus assembly protein protease CpaA